MTEQKTITTLADIEKAITPYYGMYGGLKSIELKTSMTWTEDGKTKTQEVIAESKDLSARRVLLEGMDVVKAKIELVQASLQAADEDDDLMPEKIRWGIKMSDIDKQFFSVDQFIKKELGGTRRGLMIRWEVKEGAYEFNPYTGELGKANNVS